jgi:phage terminase small subunit
MNNLAEKSLTPKQRRFTEEYLLDLNGVQAAIRAGYSLPTAAAQASRLLTKANVQDAVADAVARRAERTQITSD